MKQQHANSLIRRISFSAAFLLTLCFLFMTDVHAQQKKMTTIAATPIAMSMKQYKSTTQGLLRQKEYGNKFAESTNGTATKKIKYSDGSSLNLKLVRNPSFGGQATSIKANVKKDDKTDKSKDSQGNEWNCSTEHIQLTAQSTTFLNNDYSGTASHIYPGAVYTYDDFYNGSYKEQQGERNPLTIITDNTNIKGKPYITIDNPNTATIRTAVAQRCAHRPQRRRGWGGAVKGHQPGDAAHHAATRSKKLR